MSNVPNSVLEGLFYKMVDNLLEIETDIKEAYAEYLHTNEDGLRKMISSTAVNARSQINVLKTIVPLLFQGNKRVEFEAILSRKDDELHEIEKEVIFSKRQK